MSARDSYRCFVAHLFTSESASSARRTVGSNRVFGLVFALFFLVVAYRIAATRTWAMPAAVIFAVLALVAPGVLAWPNRMWTRFGERLHRVTSPVALTAIYVVGVLPAALLMRLGRKDPLRLKPEPDLPSYWIRRVPAGRADAGMKRPF